MYHFLGATWNFPSASSPKLSAASLKELGGAPVMSDPSELLPVNQSVFQTITDTNGSFDKLVAHLEILQQVSFFPTKKLMAYVNIIGGIRAELNMTLMEKIAHREEGNALYFDRLCIRRERELKDPDDVLLDAEMRKKDIEEEKKRLEGEEPAPPADIM
ncbi:MAG TPA: hypothetical protein VG759_22155 [Candidatus Angelobacter sp.]|jgi:hypothetical protein|nr:hypothetical protein [Candidatus Angelobacter sp.]